jgi:hypothetical protein
MCAMVRVISAAAAVAYNINNRRKGLYQANAPQKTFCSCYHFIQCISNLQTILISLGVFIFDCKKGLFIHMRIGIGNSRAHFGLK